MIARHATKSGLECAKAELDMLIEQARAELAVIRGAHQMVYADLRSRAQRLALKRGPDLV